MSSGRPRVDEKVGLGNCRGDPWAGRGWSARAYGHTGLTGTALWIDPELDLCLVLLTNRIHPRREDESTHLYIFLDLTASSTA